MGNGWFGDGDGIRRRDFLKLAGAAGGIMLLNPTGVFAQAKKRISVATGGMGGVYFVIGGGISTILTKYAGVEAAAEVTAASVDNCKLLAAKKSDLGLVMGDTGADAYKGQAMFKGKPLPLRTLTMLYPQAMHVVTSEGAGLKKVADLKGKRVSTGAPGSGTEINALRVLEAAGINPDKDIKRDRLGASESAGALKDGKIEAYFWSGGVPTSSVLDLAASPGTKMVLLPVGEDLVGKMTAKYGPVYFLAPIPKKLYSGIDYDTPTCWVGNMLLVHKDMDPNLAYVCVKSIFDNIKELQAIHKEATNITMKTGASDKAVPYHPGAAKFFKEKGFIVPVA